MFEGSRSMNAQPIYIGGSHVSCENGHRICTVGRDIYAWDVVQIDAFTDWTQPEPKPGDPINEEKCVICGAKYIRSRDFVTLHIEDHGWRPQ
jgi:hypothetical protein